MSSRLDETASLTEQRYKVLAVVMLGGIMGPIDASIVNVILPTISGFFGAPIATAQWVPQIYLLTISSLLLFYGRLGDILGYKRIYLTGLLCFVATSGLCGLAPTIYWLIVFRAIQGIGAGMMMSVPFAILTAVFPPQERGRALGINAISVSAGLALGPTLGGLLTSLWSWRLVFLINIPIGLAALLLAIKIVPDLKGKPGRVDIAGAVSAFICLFSFLFFINQVQNTGMGPVTGTAITAAVLAGICFFYVETHIPQPMVNLALFKNRTFTLGIASALLNFASQYILVFLTPFYLQRAIHYSPDKIGLLMTCFPLTVMAVAPFSGNLSDRLGTRELAITGAAICSAALVAMAFLARRCFRSGRGMAPGLLWFGYRNVSITEQQRGHGQCPPALPGDSLRHPGHSTKYRDGPGNCRGRADSLLPGPFGHRRSRTPERSGSGLFSWWSEIRFSFRGRALRPGGPVFPYATKNTHGKQVKADAPVPMA